jgi:ammonia channel protein AmtB
MKLSSLALIKLRIDDPLDAFPVHGICGMWGIAAGGLFSTEEYVMAVYPLRENLEWGVRKLKFALFFCIYFLGI